MPEPSPLIWHRQQGIWHAGHWRIVPCPAAGGGYWLFLREQDNTRLEQIGKSPMRRIGWFRDLAAAKADAKTREAGLQKKEMQR